MLAVSAAIDPENGFEAVIVRALPPGAVGVFPIADLYVNDATLSIKDQDGEEVSALNIGNGRYVFRDSAFIRENYCYTLVVEHPDYPHITSAEVCVPLAAQVPTFVVEQVFDNDLGF